MNLSISMTRTETIFGWCYFLISMFVLPSALGILSALFGLSVAAVNIVYFSINFVCTVVIFRRFLRISVKKALQTPWRCLRFSVLGFMLYYVVSFLIGIGTRFLDPGFTNANDAAILEMQQQHTVLITLSTVFLVPVYEETLHRGLIFQGLHKKSRLLAYCVSMAVFSAIHVMGYVGVYKPLTLMLCFVQYLPAGAVLAWAYEKADTIAAPILMHIAINQIGIAATR